MQDVVPVLRWAIDFDLQNRVVADFLCTGELTLATVGHVVAAQKDAVLSIRERCEKARETLSREYGLGFAKTEDEDEAPPAQFAPAAEPI